MRIKDSQKRREEKKKRSEEMRRKTRKQENTKTKAEGFALVVNEHFRGQLKDWTSDGL